jgi:hypothetical protein
VHGDPAQGIDPTGETLTQIAIAVGIGALILGMGTGAYLLNSSLNDKGSSLFVWRFGSPLGKVKGEWDAGQYLAYVKPHRTSDDWQCLQAGCFAMANIRLGTGGNDTSPWTDNNGVFNDTRGFEAFSDAESYYLSLGTTALLYAVQMQTSWVQPTPLSGASNSEIDMTTLHVQGGIFNFASLLYLPDGKTWEDLPGSASYQQSEFGLSRPVVHRTPFDPNQPNRGLAEGFGGPLRNYYLVTTNFDQSVLK